MAGPGTDSADGSDGTDTLSADTARRRRSTKVGHARLSPNEEMQFARDELDRRRKLRLQQVREQQRYLAVCVRQQVERRRRQQESHLEAELRQEWRLEQQHRKNTLTHELTHTLHGVGHAHASAKENEPDWAWLAQKKAEQKERAAQRHTHALKELKMHTHTQEQQHTRHIQARRKALEVEKNRSAKVANMPTPPPDHIESVLENVSLKKGVVVEQYSSSHHHLPETTVETHTLQVDAKAAAEEEAKRLDELDQEETRDRLEHLEKARLRGEHALKKEHLTQERHRMLLDLERMQAADWQRRRHQAPPAVSSSSHTHTHTHTLADDGQRRLEHAFQDLYTNERRVKGDLVLQLVPEPLPAPSTSSHGNDLDLTLDSDVTPVEEEEEEVKEEEEEEMEELKEAGPADMPSQSHGLQRLLERIRSQREHWNSAPTSSSLSQHPVAMATQHSDATAPMATQHSDATAPMATQHSDATAPMTTQHSDATAPMATQHSSGDVAIATPLSEDDDVAMNGLSIEMGSPARTHTHNTGLREESVLSVEPEQSQEEEEVLKQDSGVQACTTEDSHILRIQQYQQQLLDQSRQHRQSVEEARRRLDEYQRTLALRHRSVTMTTTPSAVSTATSPQASAVPMVLSGPAPALSQVLLQEGSVWGVALPPPAVVLEMLRNKQQEGNSLISALLRAIQDSSESANQGASSSQLTNQGASSSQLTNLSASSPQAASHSTREASLVPPLASALVSQNSALHDWHQLSAILEVDTPLNSTVAVPDSDARCQMPETEFLSPLDPGSFTTTISTGSYCTSSVGTDPSLCAGARSGVGVVSPFGSSLQCRKRIIAMATEHRMPDNIQLNQAESNTGLHSWAQVLQEAPGGNSSPDAESSILQSSAMFFPLQPQTDSSSSSSTHLQIRDDTVSLIAHQLSCPASASSQSDLSLPRHASASSQSDLSLPRHASASSQSDLSLPHYASNSSQSDLSQSDLSQLIGQLSSHSSQSASDGRGLSDSACRRIGQDSREEPRGRHVIGQTSGQVAGYWLAEGRDSGTSVLIGRGPTLQPVLPDDLQQSLDSFHPLEAELTHGHLSVDSEDGPSPLRADHAHLSQQAVQDSLFQSAVSLDLLPLSDSSLHDDRSPHDDRSLPASPAHTRHLISQSEEELTANMTLWERIMKTLQKLRAKHTHTA
ncbi:centrosomal protein of 295 kDa [Clupea harengus]|uniref:Centrosomal protein of 295 kDa n=1 Tax=Clupea harengus TaxID=7950 RepID=A0A8M1KQB3_CLUHA|nr:centrosomal protein of 295 kDa [Clupea harengus]